ncbi:hypothetical protein PFICI_11917 [Pestalotiopsis fici W106-1]|uniref:CN hydrolase domain-containing protein n=1 Tax=Pestalotiopsis fici (strain W106-1 / CGMCC3.15140) TaxID=1229662 RepID=W3WRN7_PESFW|nr:uncharacterized protein PFICI_11917 [Pestalotiopsis fici W106-1]ETS76530.1 hypothetical protein PFICI_11917 [Pestalotiopsis fici W106-1]
MIDIKIKAAAVHAAPVYMDKKKTLEKVVKLIARAAGEDTQLLAFPEVFVPGYPYFINAYAPNASTVAAYAAESVVVAEDLHDVQAACARHKITVVLGVSERMQGGHTLFNSVVTIDADGTILGVHRKMQPTFAERFIWGQGSGFTLKTYQTAAGYRVGGLACWEHTMNNARQALIDQGQHVHVACWPALETMAGFEGVANVQIEALMKSHALSGQTFVLCASNFVDDTCLEWMEEKLGPQDNVKAGGGWTAIIHPFCSVLAGPQTGCEDKLVTAEIQLKDLDLVKMWVDATGHYSRPEVFKLQVDKSPRWRDDQDIVGPIPYSE